MLPKGKNVICTLWKNAGITIVEVLNIMTVLNIKTFGLKYNKVPNVIAFGSK